MRNRPAIAKGAIVLLVLLLGYWWLRPQSMQAEIASVTGAIEVISKDKVTALSSSSDLTAVKLGDGDRVITKPGAAAVLRFPDTAVVTLGGQSELEVTRLSKVLQIRNFLKLVTGEIEVVKDAAFRSDFQIKTVTATIGIRGTRFTVRYDVTNQATTTKVLEGEVEVTPENRALEPVILRTGEQAIVTAQAVQRPAIVSWADWTAATAGNPGSAVGSMTLPGGGTVTVSYSGEITFAQTEAGTDYWVPAIPYVSGVVGNAPAGSDIIAISGGNATINTVTFSTPVLNPVMAIVSLGQSGAPVRYRFDAPFEILSFGSGYWGGGTLTELPDNILEGREGHGTIQFQGSHTSISWTVPVAEHWHGFTVGAASAAP